MIITKSQTSGRNGTSWRKFAASLVVAGVAAVGTVNAADITVPSTGGTYSSDAELKGTGNLTGTLKWNPNNSGNYTFDGKDFTLTHTAATGGPNGGMIWVDDVKEFTLKDITLENGKVTSSTIGANHNYGGSGFHAGFVNASVPVTVTLDNVKVTGGLVNTTAADVRAMSGGGVHLHGLTNGALNGVTVTGNTVDTTISTYATAVASGGGIYVGGSEKVVFSKNADGVTNTISGNTAQSKYSAYGGGISIAHIAENWGPTTTPADPGYIVHATIEDAEVKTNKAIGTGSGNAYGGGISISNNLTGFADKLEAGDVADGRATGTSGFFINRLSVEENTAQANSGNAFGGGLYVSQTGKAAPVTITDTNFTNNKAISVSGDAAGGAIWTNSAITLKGLMMFGGEDEEGNSLGNTVTSADGTAFGGAIFSQNNFTLGDENDEFTLGDDDNAPTGDVRVFQNNSASGVLAAGGAIASMNGTITIAGGLNIFTGNSATSTHSETDEGGYGGAIATKNDVTISGGLNVFGSAGLGYAAAGNTASHDGGAIFSDGKVTIENTASAVFAGNDAGGSGGAIHAAEVALEGGSYGDSIMFTSNEAKDSGGAIMVYSGAGTNKIENVGFLTNKAESEGGAIYFGKDHTSDTIKNSLFTGNQAGTSGGAIYSRSALTVEDSSFSANKASKWGGAIWTDQALTISGSTFTKNTAVGAGGAIFVEGQDVSSAGDKNILSISDTTFGGATAADGNSITGTGTSGGAIYVQGTANSGNVTLTDVKVLNNSAAASGASSGGGVFVYGVDNFTFTDGEVKSNKVTGTSAGNDYSVAGGGLYLTNIDKKIDISGVAFEGNTVANAGTGNAAGGAIMIALPKPNTTTITLTDVSFKNNTVTSAGTAQGGAIFSNSSFTIEAKSDNVVFSDNTTKSGTTTVNNDIYLQDIGNIVTFDADGKNITLGGGVSGNGSVKKDGTGTLTFATGSVNDYIDGTTILDGTLKVEGSWGTSGNYAGDIANAGKLQMSQASVAQTLSGTITGTGSLLKDGGNTLTITGANSYTGATTINAGSIVVGNKDALGSGTVTVGVNNGLKFASGINAVTIGGLTGSGNIALQNQAGTPAAVALTVGTNNTDTIYSGILSGTGSLIKTGGTSTLTLLGANTYSGATNIQAGKLEIGNGSLTVMARKAQNDAQIDIAGGATFATLAGGTLYVTADTNELNTIVAGSSADFFVAKGTGSVSFADDTLDLSYINKLLYYTAAYDYDTDKMSVNIHRKSAGDIKIVSPSVAESLAHYKGGNTFIDNVIGSSTDSEAVAAERFELGYNAAGAAGVGFQAAGAGDALRGGVRAQLAGQAASTPMGGGSRGQRGQLGRGMSFATTERAFWVAPMYGHQQASGLHSGGVKYGYTSNQYGAAFGVEASQGRIKFGVAAQLGGGHVKSSQTTAVHTKSDSFFGGVGLYSTMPTGYVDVVSQLGWVGTSNKLKQTNGAVELAADVHGGLIYYSIGLEKTLRFGSAYVTPLIGFDYGYVYQNAFKTADKTFSADGGGAHMVVLPIGVRVGYEYNNLRPGGYGLFTPEISARVLPNVGDTELPYTTTPTGATAAKLRSLVSDQVAGDVGFGLNWRGRATEAGVRYGVLFSERFTNQDASLMIRRTF